MANSDSECATCNSDYVQVNNQCVSKSQCQLSIHNCATCNVTLPTQCLGCKTGYSLQTDGTCGNCLTNSTQTGCSLCSSINPNVCLTCRDPRNAVDPTTGTCRPKNCLETTEWCSECDGRGRCVRCRWWAKMVRRRAGALVAPLPAARGCFHQQSCLGC